MQNVFFPGETYPSGVWSSLIIKSRGISFSRTAVEIALWNVNFSTAKKPPEGSGMTPLAIKRLPMILLCSNYKMRYISMFIYKCLPFLSHQHVNLTLRCVNITKTRKWPTRDLSDISENYLLYIYGISCLIFRCSVN